jgi:hypothetical protein
MKKQRRSWFAGKRAMLIGMLCMLAIIGGCAANWLAAEFLLGIALGIAASVALRMALNFDPEE